MCFSCRKRYPFDWKSPVGYFIAVFLEYFVLGYQFFLNSCTLGLGIGAFWFAVTATKEIRRILYSIDDETKVNGKRSKKLIGLFAEFIYAHGIVKQLSRCFNVSNS